MLDVIRMGGSVVWICLLLGVVAFIVFVERSLHLHRARIRSEDFLKGVFNILRRRNTNEAVAICDETPGPVAFLLKTAILHRDEGRDIMREAMEDASAAETSRMERRLVVIATVAQVAPLLGLLGTVLGMVELLIVLQHQAPLVQSADVSGGLMKALLSTAAGLMVAIPCYAAFNLLVVKIDRIVLDMERAKTEIIGFLRSQESGAENGSSGK